jgi:hypothetical protein
MIERVPGFSRRGTSFIHTYSSAAGGAGGPSGVILGVFEISIVENLDRCGRVGMELALSGLTHQRPPPALPGARPRPTWDGLYRSSGAIMTSDLQTSNAFSS